MIKKVIKTNLAILLVCVITISSGCTQNSRESSDTAIDLTDTPATTASDIKTLTLPYTYNDPLNPFAATSVNNLTITPLICDSLVKINPHYGIDFLTARSCDISPNQATFTLKEGITFWDGSELKASDVVYSFNKAKESQNYSSQLSGIKSASGWGNQVTLTLACANSNILYLCDFPIVKSGSVEGDLEPIGCGRYELTKEGNSKLLKYYDNYYNKKAPKFKKIYLSYSPGVDTTESGIKSSTLNVAYRGTLNNSMSGTGSVSVCTPLTHLVYIGFNASSGLCSNEIFRRALCAAISKEDFLRTVYADNGLLTSMPIYPKMYADDLTNITPNGLKQANELLDQLGFTQRDQYQNRLNGGAAISIDLMIPQNSSYKTTAANNIKSSLKQCGISVNIVSVDNDTFGTKIAQGDYFTYLGEAVQQNDCSLDPFLPGGSLGGGLKFSQELISSYQNLLEGGTSYKEFSTLFLKEMPILPLCYRNGVLVHSNNLKSTIVASVDDNFYNIEEWK